jgi:multiple sugar transport system substrate-binding protein
MVLFIAHATEINNRKASKVVGRIGYAPVPGGTSLLGGWSLAINSKSRAKDRAFEFISWATGPETAIPATILGGTTSSIGLYKSSELLSVYPWLPKALESFTTIRKRMLPRSYLEAGFSEREFEKILGNAVYQCVTGACTPEEALARAAGRLRKVVLS